MMFKKICQMPITKIDIRMHLAVRHRERESEIDRPDRFAFQRMFLPQSHF
jgi:hypothetical protein